MATMAELKQQVAETIGVEKSVLAYMAGIKEKLQELIDLGATPEELQTLVDQMDASEKEMVAAMQENPEPPPPPEG